MLDSADKALEGMLAEGVSASEVLDALSSAGFSVDGPTDDAPGEFKDGPDMAQEKGPLPAFGPEARQRALSAINSK